MAIDNYPPITPPSGFLPPLARLRTCTTETVLVALANLREFCWPLPVPVRKSDTLIHDVLVPDSGYASAEEDEDDDDDGNIHLDPFERDFAIRWITGFIARSDVWAEEDEARTVLVDEAAQILLLFAADPGAEEECAIVRSFHFPNDVHVELNDAPLSTSDHTSVGLQSWASSILLAERMCAAPSDFHLRGRILELGAGTGMLSIAVAKLLPAIIVATDYHPDVLFNLQANVATNKSNVIVQKFDWETPSYEAPLDRPFEVILAADVIYHVEHAAWIRNCVERLLAKDGVFWLMIPVRSTGRHEGMTCTVDAVFPQADRGLVIIDRAEVQRQGGVGRADEGGYKLFKIGWVA
ncbi:S-adenosyl-L-methionine-dependent methyltransferase [Mucidula mucida]|nr:S-adenosyl-L-methionine-dependent methyltransferase [Mucidula mucida]